MIYRKRSVKSQYSLSMTKHFVKLSLGLRVWYIERHNVFHSMVSIKDYGYATIVKHYSFPWRKTISRKVAERLSHLGINYTKPLVEAIKGH